MRFVFDIDSHSRRVRLDHSSTIDGLTGKIQFQSRVRSSLTLNAGDRTGFPNERRFLWFSCRSWNTLSSDDRSFDGRRDFLLYRRRTAIRMTRGDPRQQTSDYFRRGFDFISKELTGTVFERDRSFLNILDLVEDFARGASSCSTWSTSVVDRMRSTSVQYCCSSTWTRYFLGWHWMIVPECLRKDKDLSLPEMFVRRMRRQTICHHRVALPREIHSVSKGFYSTQWMCPCCRWNRVVCVSSSMSMKKINKCSFRIAHRT